MTFERTSVRKMPNSFVSGLMLWEKKFSEAMDVNKDFLSPDFLQSCSIEKSLWVCHPENQVRRQESSYREIFINPQKQGQGLARL